MFAWIDRLLEEDKQKAEVELRPQVDSTNPQTRAAPLPKQPLKASATSVVEPGLAAEAIPIRNHSHPSMLGHFSLAPLKFYGLPRDIEKTFLQDLNGAIIAFNSADSNFNKKKHLKRIEEAIHTVEVHTRPDDLACAIPFHSLKTKLFRKIKRCYFELGSISMLPEGRESSPLAELIANMSPEKIDSLMAILVKGKQVDLAGQLNALYDADDSSSESTRFRRFLATHSINFLGGANSKNFRIESLLTGVTKVLKVDCRLNMPKTVEAHLLNRLPEIMIAVDIERQALARDSSGALISRSLMVTKLCPDGSLLEHAVRLMRVTRVDTFYENANAIMSEMANILMKIQSEHCLFTDAKIDNWLMDENGKLRLADTKSFLFLDSYGNYKQSKPENRYTRVLRSFQFSPPELWERPTMCRGEPVHAYILGKNLFSFLTGTIPPATPEISEDVFVRHPVFDSEIGNEYKKMIQALVKQEPLARIGLREAHYKLREIKLLQNPIYKSALVTLKNLRYGEFDKAIDKYLIECKQRIFANEAMCDEVANEMRELGSRLSDEVNREIRAMITSFRDNASLFSIGMGRKADSIEHAMAALPLEDRVNLLDSMSPKVTELLKAVAAHRLFGKEILTEEGKIYAENTANSFKTFKAKFSDKFRERHDVVSLEESEQQYTRR